MRNMMLIVAVASAALAPSIGFARAAAHGHGYGTSAPYHSQQTRPFPIDSGYGPPSNWNEIEQSGCNTSGCG